MPPSPDDRFRIASISKTITAITTLRLVEQGLLTLDDPVGDVLIRQLGVTNADADAANITVRGLLSHTAGLGKGQDLMFGNGAVSYADAAAQALTSVGGSGYNYSNLGFVLLTVLIESVTGKTYERVVNDELLEPLGIEGMRMTSTYELGPDEVSHHPRPGPAVHGSARRCGGLERDARRPRHDRQLDRPQDAGLEGAVAPDDDGDALRGSPPAPSPAGTASA